MNIEGMNVISVDDNKSNLLMIEIFSKKLNINIHSFQNPIEALESCKNINYDLLLIDYMMPEMDGLKFIERFRSLDNNTPIIMITAAGENQDLHLKALELGATDFLTKPLNTVIFQARVRNLLKLKKSLNIISNEADILTIKVKEATKEIKEHEEELLHILGQVSEYKDPETNKHILRVSNYSKLIAKTYGLNEKIQDTIFHAAQFHDIGKIAIPDNILLKPDSLTIEEFEIMKSHSYKGYKLLKNSKSPYLRAGSVIACSHHEKYDGTGYPNALKGNMIPLLGRIVAIADVFDALCSCRPYKGAWNFEQSYQYILEHKGEHFDPECVDCFIQCKSEIRKIFEKYQEVEDI